VRPKYTLKADRLVPIEIYEFSDKIVFSHEDCCDTVDIEPVAEADLLDYLLSRQADRKGTDWEAPNLTGAVKSLLDIVDLLGEGKPIVIGKKTLNRLREAVARVEKKKVAVVEDDGEID